MDARRLLARVAQADAQGHRRRCARRRCATAATGAALSTVRHLLAAAAARLVGDEARAEAGILLAHVLGQSRAWLFAWPEFKVETEPAARFDQLIDARLRGEPIAYLTGRRAFWSLELEVGSGVLIPRPETELLVELALARMAPDASCTVADLGTGSGAIALSLARERPRVQVLATDASSDALAIARANAQRLAIGNVAFAQGDWCDALGDARFDLVVSNPPYIAQGDPHLREGDLRFEPSGALASGPDGLDAIRRIVADAPRHLRPHGALLLEHGWDQAERVRALLRESGFVGIESVRDAAGHERITLGIL